MDSALLLGLDFGTDSVRALLLDASNGKELASEVSWYPRWKKQQYCKAQENRFRQHPLDYLEAMTSAITACLSQIPGSFERVKGLGIDTTGSTPAFADEKGQVLALNPDFAEDPDACFILWKDHTSLKEAAKINELAQTWQGPQYTAFVGGIYSSEWFWAKAAHVFNTNKKLAEKAVTLVEHCDWIPAVLCGVDNYKDIKRSRCAAGHKALWHQSFGGYPEKSFIKALHPQLEKILESLGTETYTSDQEAGKLCEAWAEKLGLPAGISVAVGAFDAHMGAVGAGIEEGTFLRIMGTSTCDIMVSSLPKQQGKESLVKGICGQVDGSVLPDMLGLEAGQSAYGDLFAWFKNLLAWPVKKAQESGLVGNDLAEKISDSIILWLDAEACKLPPGALGVRALDWFNGRRTPDADQSLKGAFTGLSLGSDAASLYKALVEAAAFGSRAIVDRFRREGHAVCKVGAIGGVAKKSALVMQTLANVLNMPIQVRSSEQCCALGAAIFAGSAAGLFKDSQEAMKTLASGIERTYNPQAELVEIYETLYKDYQALGSFIEKETHKK